ncbi:uncharacterized protein N7515_009361 [Penicillium bovifimosum]|uniref:Dynamin-binding protein n=1 Tax=Penicillium bovifimosum TaxID=126998 RepID=A0A9W9KVY1_9EURO|nr:uncharacterized protein N7515_009361 [Penicillium bovifimosum]KAJ5121400.1 hypothetical protein N7515_009361 [Penicillium bovifimosum]
MSGGDEQGFDIRHCEPPSFGRQSPAPEFGQSTHDHTAASLVDSPTVSFSPQARSPTTYSPLPSGFDPLHNLHTSANHLSSGDPLEDRRGRESPDPADYYRQRGALSGTSSNVSEGSGGVRTGMAPADHPTAGDRVSSLPTNMLQSSRTRRQPYRSISDSPTLGEPSATVPAFPSNHTRSRQPSTQELINRFNKTSDQVLPLPSGPTSRTVSPAGSGDGERHRALPRRSQYRDSLPDSITSHPRAPIDSTPSSPGTEEFEPSLSANDCIPPPLFQRIPKSHPRRSLFGELLSIDTKVNNSAISRLQRRGSDGSIPSPNPSSLEPHDQYSAKPPLTPTAWYLGHTTSLEAVHAGIRNTGNHRRNLSDLHTTREPLADPWTPEMAVPAPLQRAKPGHGSPPDSPNSKSRIPIYSHRLITASGPESLSPSSNPTFSSRSAAITSPPKGSSRLPIPSPKHSPPRMPSDDPTSFATSSRPRRDPTSGRIHNQTSESSRRLQAYITEPPAKQSPQLRSSRPRQPVSHGALVSPRSKVGDTVLNIQKHANSNDSRSRPQRKLPELGKVDFDARRRHIQQAINRHTTNSSVQEIKNERREIRSAAAEPHRPALVRDQKADENTKYPADAHPSNPSLAVTNATADEMATIVKEPGSSVEYQENGVGVTPRLQLNTVVSTSETAAPHTTMDSPTLGFTQGVNSTTSGDVQPGNDGRPQSATTTGSDETHVTTFDPEPQSGLLQRNPSVSHRTLLSQIMQIRESSPSDDSCDEPDCSLSENDDRESIQIMLRDTTYYNSSSSTNTQDPCRAPAQQSQDKMNTRWSIGSWSSVQNQNSTCDEQCDESGDDFLLHGRETEPPTETCSAVSTRPASIADEQSSAPIQDHGVMGPNTLQTSGNYSTNYFSTPPKLARLGRWDSKRVTQLYLEELTRGRNYNITSAIQAPPAEPRSHPTDAHNEGRPDSLTDDPVVVPGFQDVPVSARHSHTASLVGRDDWEHASPSIMDWMRIAAEDGAVTPSAEVDGMRTDGVLTPRVVSSTTKDAGATSTNNNNALSFGTESHVESIASVPFPSASTLLPPSTNSTFDASGDSLIGSGHVELNRSIQTAPRDAKHSPGSSEDSSLLRLESLQSPAAAGSSATSLAPSTEQTVQAGTKMSPSPEQKRLKKRRHIIKELVDTEHTFGHDMMVIEDIYKSTANTLLEADDVKILFGNSDQIANFSDTFLYHLKQAARSIYVMPASQRWTSKRSRTNQAVDPMPSETNERSEYEGMSDLEKDRATSVGQVFVTYMTQMEKVYTDYLKNHDSANKKLQALQRIPNVGIWLSECRNCAHDLTTAWDLDSLLVKPVQRILKYPLILRDLLESTPNDHPDRAMIAAALEEVTNVSHRINAMKKRAELVGQAVGRKRNQSDVRAGLSKAFGRRTEKFRQQVGLSDLFEDKVYDSLAQKLGDGYFQLQVVMRDVESYSRDVQLYVNQFNEYADSIADIIGMSPSPYPQLEAKWRQFKMTVHDIVTTALPEHLAVVRKTVIEPMVELLGLYNAPQRVMRKRDKRLPEYARYKAIQDRGDKPDKKTTDQGEQFLALNETLKDELPRLYALTSKLMEATLKNFIEIQTVWYSILQKKIGVHVDLFPSDLERLIGEFNSEHILMEARVEELTSCNGSLLAHSLNLVPVSPTEREHNPMSSRRPSTVNSSSARRSGSMTSDSPKVSRDFSVGSQSYQSPLMEDQSRRSSRYRADSIFSGRVVSDTPNQLLQQVTSSPAPPRTSDVEPFPSLPRLSLDTPFLTDVISSSHSSNAPTSPTDRYSGFFSSAMPMSDTPIDNYPPGERSASLTGPATLFCAASVCDFNIETRTEGGYPYLTYVSGDVFDIIGEKGELWLARNQDDSTRTVGWIWNRHVVKIDD